MRGNTDEEEEVGRGLQNLRGFLRNCRVFLPSCPICMKQPGGEVTAAAAARFEKDRELEDAIIRKRKSPLVPLRDSRERGGKDTET